MLSTVSPDHVRWVAVLDRTIVIFRDPRDVIASEYVMRTGVFFDAAVAELTLEEYTRKRFEVVSVRSNKTHGRCIFSNMEHHRRTKHACRFLPQIRQVVSSNEWFPR